MLDAIGCSCYSLCFLVLLVKCCLCFLCIESDCDSPAVLVTSKDVVSDVGKVDVIDSLDGPVITVESHNSVSSV